MRVVLSPEAEADVADARRWYNQQRPDGTLGDEFLDAVESTLEAIATRPQSFRTLRGEVRRANLRRFPYAVLFVQHQDEITVVAVLHAARDPSIGEQRSP